MGAHITEFVNVRRTDIGVDGTSLNVFFNAFVSGGKLDSSKARNNKIVNINILLTNGLGSYSVRQFDI